VSAHGRRRSLAGGLLLAIALTLGACGAGDGPRIQAEFTSASGLLEGNEVRIQGAPAGSVERIKLTDRNTALVTLHLKDGTAAPRRDATAAIRPVDLLGDIYVSLSPGDDSRPLNGPIRPGATSNAPRLSDLLSTFRPSVRRGLQALFVELGTGAENRGDDLGRAAVALRPALQATDELMIELGSQRASLRDLISDARRTTRQLADRNRALGGLVGGLATTLATTARRSRDLDATLATAPGLLIRLGRTSRGLSRTSRAATPLARSVGEAAPQLTRATRELPAFLKKTERAAGPTRKLVRRLSSFLTKGGPTFSELDSGLGTLRGVAPGLSSFVSALIPAAAPISDGFFVNFADQGAEPGRQPFDPFADPARHYWRGAAVFTCEAFGVKIAPNCLDQFLDMPAKKSRPADTPDPARTLQGTKAPSSPVGRLPQPPQISDVPRLLESAGDAVGKALQKTVDALPAPPALDRGSSGDRDLLDYLLGP